jgi:ApeA N-terminal domain 1
MDSAVALKRNLISAKQSQLLRNRRRFEGNVLPKAEHRTHVDAVVNAAPDELREWARVRLQDVNRKSFRDALAELIATLPAAMKDALGDPETLAERVRVTRNYLTHWSQGLEAKAARGTELFALTRALRAILESLLLLQLGFAAHGYGRGQANWQISCHR